MTLDPLTSYILEKALAGPQAELQPNIVSANFAVETTHVRRLLVSLDSCGLIGVSRWDDEKQTERWLREFANPNAFFESPCDVGHVRVSLQLKGREVLEKLKEDHRRLSQQPEGFVSMAAGR